MNCPKMESDYQLLETHGQSSDVHIGSPSYAHNCRSVAFSDGADEFDPMPSSSVPPLSNHSNDTREGAFIGPAVPPDFSSESNTSTSAPSDSLLASCDKKNCLTAPTLPECHVLQQPSSPNTLTVPDGVCTVTLPDDNGTSNMDTPAPFNLRSATSTGVCDVDLLTITTISNSQSSLPTPCTVTVVQSSTSTSSTSSLPSTELSVSTVISLPSDTQIPDNARSEPEVVVSKLDATTSLIPSCADKHDTSVCSATETLESHVNTPEFTTSASLSSALNVLVSSTSLSNDQQSYCDMAPSCVVSDARSSIAPFVQNTIGPPLLPLTGSLYPSFAQSLGDISTTLPNLPPTVTAAPLPPFFRFTLVPMSPNGDFPAVQLNLPDLPIVILQVLPLSGARVGEQYVINVPTPLILNGINSALANGGTVSGGPIMLSIAPSGAVPPPDTIGHCVNPSTLVSHASQDPNTVSGALLPSLNYTSVTSSTVPSVLVSLPLGVVSNGLAPVRLPVSSIPQLTSNPSISLSNGGKRMRAIAPKPCLNLALRSFTACLSGSTLRTTPSSKTASKKSSVVVNAGNSPTGELLSTPAATLECPVTMNSQLLAVKGKKVSILPIYSSVRSGRGRRKTGIFPSSALSTCNTAPVVLTTSHCCPISSSGVTPSSDAVLAPRSSVPTLIHPTFTTQPILIPNSTSPGISGPVAPTGQLPPTFLFGGPFAPGSTPGSTHPYIIPQPFPFHGSCSSFPASIYNPSNCSTTLPPATSPISIAGPMPPASSAPVYPSGPPTALATVDPTTGMVTHYSAPCVPLGLPTGSSTDQTTFGLPIVYSQSNQNALGFIVPTASQANPLVFPVPGHPMLPAQLPPLPTTLSSRASSIGLDSICSLDQSISTSFLPSCPLSAESLVPSSTHPSAVQMSQSLGTLIPAPASYLTPSDDNSTPLIPVFSTASEHATDSSVISSSYEVLTLDEDPKDDLISIAWRLTQMDDEPTLSRDLGQQHAVIQSNNLSDGSGSYGALFEPCTQDKLGYAFSEACGDLYALHSDGAGECESAEVVLLDSKRSSLVSVPHSSGTDRFSVSSESTGNADIDALLAAAAMVGAASGVGDAQSAVTVPVPSSFSAINSQDTTTRQPTPRSPLSPLVTASVPTIRALSPHLSIGVTEAQSTSSLASVETVVSNEDHNGQLPALVEKEPTDLLPSDLFADFDDPPRDDAFTRESAETLSGFDESDEPTSLAAALGCSDEDAADLKSILDPEAHNLGETGAVSDSFLNSLVGAPELDLGDGDENGEHLFDADFDVCAPVSLRQSNVVKRGSLNCVHNLHDSSLSDLNADRFDLDYSELTKDSSQAEVTLVTDMPIPSSHQVRSLLRNTAPTVLPYRFASSRLVLTSEESKIFDGFFVPSKSNKRNNRNCRLGTQTADDFLGVDFADTVGEYTTAEQFDEALMLLGPPPSSPVHYPINSQTVISTLTNSIPNQENAEASIILPETTKPAAVQPFPTVAACAEEGSPLLPSSSPGNVSKDIEAAHVDPTSAFGASDDKGTNQLLDSSFGVTPGLVSSLRSSDDTLVLSSLTPERQSANAFEASGSVTSSSAIELNEPTDSNASVTEPCSLSTSIDRMASADPACGVETGTDLPHICPTETLENLQIFTEAVSGNLLDYEDTEETIAMEIDQVEPTSSHSPYLVSEGVRTSSPLNIDGIPSHCGDGLNALSTVSTPIRRRTRSASLAITAHTASLTSTPNALLSFTQKYIRRRLASAPATNDTTPSRSRRCSLSTLLTPFIRSRGSLRKQVASPVSQPCTGQPDDRSPQCSSASSQGAADSSNSSVPPSSSSWLPKLPGNGISPRSITNSSILGVLASSSALLEAAVEGMVSDSDISPIKSSIEGLETLDRMLRSCERQSKQTMESSTSKSSCITSSLGNATSSNSLASECMATKISTEEDERHSTSESIASFSGVKQVHIHDRIPTLLVKQTSVTRKGRPRRLKRRIGRKPSNFPSNSDPGSHSPKSTHCLPLSEASLSLSTSTTPPVYTTSHCTLLLPSSERPLSFGLSSDVASDLSSGPNPLMEANFEQHVPRLNLAFQGPLFPDIVPSSPEIEEPKRVLQLISTPPDVGLTADFSLGCLPRNKISSLRSTRRRHHRRRSKRISKTRQEAPTSLADYTETHDHLPLSCSVPNTVPIAPIHLAIPADNASFSRFADATDLPSFTTIQRSGSTQTASSSRLSSSVWSQLPGSGTLLFKEFCKSDLEFKQSSPTHSGIVPECMDHSPSSQSCSTHLRSTDEFTVTDSPHLNSQSSIHTSVLSVDSSSGVSCAVHSGFSAPAFPNLLVSSQSATASNVSDSPIVRSASSTPVSSGSGLTIVTTAVVGQLQFTNVIPTSSSFFSINNWPSVSLGTSNSITRHTWNPSISILSVPSPQFAGMTFGSFAGAAAFRATSFSALAAKANAATGTTNPNDISFWINRPSFSDLAKATASDRTSVLCGRFKNLNQSPEVTTCACSSLSTHKEGVPSHAAYAMRLFQSYSFRDTSAAKCNSTYYSEVDYPTTEPQPVEPHASEVASSPINSVATVTVGSSVSSHRLIRRRRSVGKSLRRRRGCRAVRPRISTVSKPTDTSQAFPNPEPEKSSSLSKFVSESDMPSFSISGSDKSEHPPVHHGHGHFTPLNYTAHSTSHIECSTPSLNRSREKPTTPECNECDVGLSACKSPSGCPPCEPEDVNSNSTSELPGTPAVQSCGVPTVLLTQLGRVSHCSPPSSLASAGRNGSSLTPSPSRPSPSTIDATGVTLCTPTYNGGDLVPVRVSSAVPGDAQASPRFISSRLHDPVCSHSSEDLRVAPQHPPIKLRLNLKSTKTKKCMNKAKMKQPLSFTIVTECTDQSLPVISSSTPTTLNIRLKSHPDSSSATISSALDRRKRKTRSKKCSTKRPRQVDSQYTSLCVGGDSERSAFKDNPAPSTVTIKLTSPSLPNQFTTPGHSVASTVFQSIRTPVFSKKIFSTAKQDRRSSYAQLSRPWRSGISGSPRKRGISKICSVVTAKSVTLKRPRLDSTVISSATHSLPSGTGKRGLPPTPFRSNHLGRGRIGRPSSAATCCVVPVAATPDHRNCDTEDSRGIRLVIRLGKSSSCHTEFQEDSSVTSAVVMPATTQVVHTASPSSSESPIASDPDAEDLRAMDNDSFADSQLEDITNSRKSIGLGGFEFCIAPEAQTYMDQNQIQISRCLNHAVSVHIESGGVSDIPPSPGHGSGSSGDALLRSALIRNSEFATGLGIPFSLDCSQASYVTHHSRAELTYDTGTLHNQTCSDGDRNSAAATRQHFDSIYKGPESYTSMNATSMAEARSLSNDHTYPYESRACDTGLFPVCSLRKVAPVHVHPGVSAFGQAIPIKATGFLDT